MFVRNSLGEPAHKMLVELDALRSSNVDVDRHSAEQVRLFAGRYASSEQQFIRIVIVIAIIIITPPPSSPPSSSTSSSHLHRQVLRIFAAMDADRSGVLTFDQAHSTEVLYQS
jgi:hypothetical protein